MHIQDLHAVVSGAAGGIGQAVCTMLLEQGAAKVGYLGRESPRFREHFAALAERFSPDRVIALRADVRDPDQVAAAMDAFAAAAGGLDLLVNNAGVLLDGAIFSLSFRGLTTYPITKWRETLDTNLTGQFLLIQAGLKHILAKRSTPLSPDERCRALIINLSSVSRQGRAGQAAYSASKGGVASLTLSLAQELAPYRVRCVAIAPGLVQTPMAASIPEAYREEMIARTGVRRMGRPEEIAHAVKFCIENEFFNGRVLEIDGGTF